LRIVHLIVGMIPKFNLIKCTLQRRHDDVASARSSTRSQCVAVSVDARMEASPGALSLAQQNVMHGVIVWPALQSEGLCLREIL
jgi:hypothetical protein